MSVHSTLYCTVQYTVHHCTVLYCPVLSCTVPYRRLYYAVHCTAQAAAEARLPYEIDPAKVLDGPQALQQNVRNLEDLCSQLLDASAQADKVHTGMHGRVLIRLQ